MRDRIIATLGVVVLVLIAVGMVASSIVGGSADKHLSSTGTSSTTSTTVTSSSTTTTAAPSDVDKVVTAVEAFVEKTRGLQFKHPVPVTLLSGDPFKQRLLENADESDSRKQIDLAQRSLRAVGLIDANVDLYEVVRRFIGDAVVGFYDAKKKDLVVRAGALNPYARTVLAHELTHALDDQWFGIDRPDLDKPGNDEAAAAFQALTEGNAVRVQITYLRQLSAVQQAQAALEEQSAASSVDTKGVPDVVQEIVAWPYEVGPTFVNALLGAGGEQRVDDAFTNPPTTTEQIVDPPAYLNHLPVVHVDVPKADGTTLDSGIYGYASLVETLEPVVGASQAKTAADGWAGDAYVLWDAGNGRSCARATFVMRTANDLRQLTSTLTTWAADRHAQVVPGSGNVSFTSCG